MTFFRKTFRLATILFKDTLDWLNRIFNAVEERTQHGIFESLFKILQNMYDSSAKFWSRFGEDITEGIISLLTTLTKVTEYIAKNWHIFEPLFYLIAGRAVVGAGSSILGFLGKIISWFFRLARDR